MGSPGSWESDSSGRHSFFVFFEPLNKLAVSDGLFVTPARVEQFTRRCA
jgi:hypothetical protein